MYKLDIGKRIDTFYSDYAKSFLIGMSDPFLVPTHDRLMLEREIELLDRERENPRSREQIAAYESEINRHNFSGMIGEHPEFLRRRLTNPASLGSGLSIAAVVAPAFITEDLRYGIATLAILALTNSLSKYYENKRHRHVSAHISE